MAVVLLVAPASSVTDLANAGHNPFSGLSKEPQPNEHAAQADLTDIGSTDCCRIRQ